MRLLGRSRPPATPTPTPICRAPFVSLSLDVGGRVTVCGANFHLLLGHIGERPLADMWHGPEVQQLRDALTAGDLDLGCDRCAGPLRAGDRRGALAYSFDIFEVEAAPRWPRRLELALSTTCNLQCTMCSGEFSSAIRTQREQLPALPSRYDDRFFEELRPFLHHVEQVRFFGGEPFLAEESFRVWDLMIEEGVAPESNVTTNGTRLTPRVERVLQRLPVSIGVSLDGTTRETVERIRAGASFDELMANLDRFDHHTRRWGTSLSLTFCVMVDNWFELGDFLLLGERRGWEVYVNQVHQPPAQSLFHLPLAELDEVLRALGAQEPALLPRLDRNRQVWVGQMDRLRRHRDALAAGLGPASAEPWLPVLRALVAAGRDLDAQRRILRDHLPDAQLGELHSDRDDHVTHAQEYAGLPDQELLGRRAGVVRDLLLERHPAIRVAAQEQGGGVTARVFHLDGGPVPTAVLTSTFARGEGADLQVVRLSGLSRMAPPATRVSIAGRPPSP
jgi:MoaA/NifB/PqqE/SkfB family radical SAM enzyme